MGFPFHSAIVWCVEETSLCWSCANRTSGGKVESNFYYSCLGAVSVVSAYTNKWPQKKQWCVIFGVFRHHTCKLNCFSWHKDDCLAWRGVVLTALGAGRILQGNVWSNMTIKVSASRGQELGTRFSARTILWSCWTEIQFGWVITIYLQSGRWNCAGTSRDFLLLLFIMEFLCDIIAFFFFTLGSSDVEIIFTQSNLIMAASQSRGMKKSCHHRLKLHHHDDSWILFYPLDVFVHLWFHRR